MANHDDLTPAAGNGLLHRRLFLTGGASLAGAAGLALLTPRAAPAQPPAVPIWSTTPGPGAHGYGQRSRFEDGVQRSAGGSPGAPGAGASRTPLEQLEGSITPNALHFERHHNGIPDIDPDQHRLLIHGLVERPLLFDLNTLSRYPLISNIRFVECSGNSGANNAAEPPQQTAGGLHGLVSGAEWTGVPLSVLLDEAGVRPEARSIVAEGADSAVQRY